MPNWGTSLDVGQERLRGQRASSASPTVGDGCQCQVVRSQLQPLPQHSLCRSQARPALSMSTSAHFTQTQEPEIIPILQMRK